jgi:hypothetical protein
MIASDELDIYGIEPLGQGGVDLVDLPDWLSPEAGICFCVDHQESSAADILLALAMLWGRNEGPRLLDEWWMAGALTAAGLRACAASIWQEAEHPQREIDPEVWLEIFAAAAFKVPTVPLTIYRGATWDRRDGMSWTTSLEKARWFANRYTSYEGARQTTVFQATAQPSSILCVVDDEVIDGRGEHEVIALPNLLTDIAPLLEASSKESREHP